MFERFTDRARRVVVLAQEEARMLNHNYIGTEHILLGLIHEGEGVAAKALESLGISLEAVRSQVEEIIGQGQQAPSGHIPFTPRAKKVLELSLREALQLGGLLGLIGSGVVSASPAQALLLAPPIARSDEDAARIINLVDHLFQSGRRRAEPVASFAEFEAVLVRLAASGPRSALRAADLLAAEELRDAAFEIAAKICTKSRFVIRRAKESLNAIDPVDVKRSYRYEQGFTFELNLSGVADELRDDFAGTTKAEASPGTNTEG